MRIKGDQRGFTLVELLASMAVGGMVLALLVSSTFQTLRVTTGSGTQITALLDIKWVARQITSDVRMAQETPNLVDGAPLPVNSLILDWTTWYDDAGQLKSVARRCEYTLLAGGEVQRIYDPDTSVALNELTSTYGKYISSLEFSRQGNVVIVTVTSSPEDSAETAEELTYYIGLRQMVSP